jgi:adenylylsulfate kinase-like enzyme
MFTKKRNVIIWLTGQPGSGKSELAKRLYSQYKKQGPAVIIDGDDLREKTGNFDYTQTGREANIKNAQLLARFLYKSGFTVIVALVSPYITMRDLLKKEFGYANFHEIYLYYKNTIRGKEDYHVDNYEPPTKNFLSLDTTKDTPKESYQKILKYIQTKEFDLFKT